jgi:hypothetical protein
VQLSSISPDLDLVNRKQDRHEARDQTRPNLSRHEGTDQPGPGDSQDRGFYAGEQIGKLDDATREGLRKYQQAEGLKVTGTLNKITLEKMNITLTDKQRAM